MLSSSGGADGIGPGCESGAMDAENKTGRPNSRTTQAHAVALGLPEVDVAMVKSTVRVMELADSTSRSASFVSGNAD